MPTLILVSDRRALVPFTSMRDLHRKCRDYADPVTGLPSCPDCAAATTVDLAFAQGGDASDDGDGSIDCPYPPWHTGHGDLRVEDLRDAWLAGHTAAHVGVSR